MTKIPIGHEALLSNGNKEQNDLIAGLEVEEVKRFRVGVVCLFNVPLDPAIDDSFSLTKGILLCQRPVDVDRLQRI